LVDGSAPWAVAITAQKGIINRRIRPWRKT